MLRVNEEIYEYVFFLQSVRTHLRQRTAVSGRKKAFVTIQANGIATWWFIAWKHVDFAEEPVPVTLTEKQKVLY